MSVDDELDPIAWYLKNGVALARKIEAEVSFCGWHVALTGGVLRRGYSRKDLDLVFYPHQRTAKDPRPRVKELRAALERCGLHLVRKAAWLRRKWREKGIMDRKHVEVWATRSGYRIDVILLS